MKHIASYLLGAVDILGAAVANPASDYGADYGPLSPDQLAQLDRALTPAEQAAVDEAQGKAADTTLKVERAKGGPQSATVEVTPKGAVIKSLGTRVVPMVRRAGIPWWQIALAAAGCAAIGVGLYKVTVKK
jgi:hypothetical protein